MKHNLFIASIFLLVSQAFFAQETKAQVVTDSVKTNAVPNLEKQQAAEKAQQDAVAKAQKEQQKAQEKA